MEKYELINKPKKNWKNGNSVRSVHTYTKKYLYHKNAHHPHNKNPNLYKKINKEIESYWNNSQKNYSIERNEWRLWMEYKSWEDEKKKWRTAKPSYRLIGGRKINK